MEKDDLLNSDNGLLAEPMPTYGTARAEADTPTDTLDDEADDCFSYPGSRIYKIGVCFGFQLVESVPTDAFDVKMDEVMHGI